MLHRLLQLLVAELFAFGAFVCGGLALLGAAVTSIGDSQLPLVWSWSAVALFAAAAYGFGAVGVRRLRVVFARRSLGDSTDSERAPS